MSKRSFGRLQQEFVKERKQSPVNFGKVGQGGVRGNNRGVKVFEEKTKKKFLRKDSLVS